MYKTVNNFQKPREMLMDKGPAYLSDQQLVALLLGSGTRSQPLPSLSAEVVRILDRENSTFNPETFRKIRGIGIAKYCTLAAAFELSKRRLLPSMDQIRGPEDVYQALYHFRDRKQESFFCLSLNGAHDIIALRTVTTGIVNKTLVHPREVFADPITDRAAAIIIAHNHPSGNLDPSPDDKDITIRLREAGNLLGIPLLDHVVFSSRGFKSLMNKQPAFV